MSQTKHTPGPWILTPREGSDTTDIVSSCETGWEIATVIGGINDSFTEAGSAESIANAKLIAAAPDMLNALLDAKKHLEGYCFGDNQERTDVFNNITKAIAKATT